MLEIIDRADSNLNGLEQAYIDVIDTVNSSCQIAFAEGNSFLSSLRDGDLVTNIDDDGQVISSTNSWATFDPTCVAETTVSSLNGVLGTLNEIFATSSRSDLDVPIGPLTAAIPELNRVSTRTSDVQETTNAFYAMTGYETSFDGLPITGNIGVRVVQTDITSTGYRPELSVLTDDDGGLTLVQGRADPSDMGVTRRFSSSSTDDDEDDPTTIQQLISQVSGDGNPAIEPLMSWKWTPILSLKIVIMGMYLRAKKTVPLFKSTKALSRQVTCRVFPSIRYPLKLTTKLTTLTSK